MEVSGIQWNKIRMIGKGGSSNVYQCKIIKGNDMLENGSNIAVKEIQTDGLTKEQIMGLRGEVDTIKNLSHPNIISYIGTQQESNMFYILLEFADRGSIRHFYQEHGALTPQQVSNCTFQMLQGLSYLHSNGIAHRDIKGANVLITIDGMIKLADFGASKKYEMESLVSGIKGTPHWMAPEVIKGTQMTTGWLKADVWSLGCTVVEMCTASLPFCKFENPMTAMYHIANGEAPVIDPSKCNNKSATGSNGEPPHENTGDEMEQMVAIMNNFVKLCCQADPEKRPSVDHLLGFNDHINEDDVSVELDTEQDLVSHLFLELGANLKNCLLVDVSEEVVAEMEEINRINSEEVLLGSGAGPRLTISPNKSLDGTATDIDVDAQYRCDTGAKTAVRGVRLNTGGLSGNGGWNSRKGCYTPLAYTPHSRGCSRGGLSSSHSKFFMDSNTNTNTVSNASTSNATEGVIPVRVLGNRDRFPSFGGGASSTSSILLGSNIPMESNENEEEEEEQLYGAKLQEEITGIHHSTIEEVEEIYSNPPSPPASLPPSPPPEVGCLDVDVSTNRHFSDPSMEQEEEYEDDFDVIVIEPHFSPSGIGGTAGMSTGEGGRVRSVEFVTPPPTQPQPPQSNKHGDIANHRGSNCPRNYDCIKTPDSINAVPTSPIYVKGHHTDSLNIHNPKKHEGDRIDSHQPNKNNNDKLKKNRVIHDSGRPTDIDHTMNLSPTVKKVVVNAKPKPSPPSTLGNKTQFPNGHVMGMEESFGILNRKMKKRLKQTERNKKKGMNGSGNSDYSTGQNSNGKRQPKKIPKELPANAAARHDSDPCEYEEMQHKHSLNIASYGNEASESSSVHSKDKLSGRGKPGFNHNLINNQVNNAQRSVHINDREGNDGAKNRNQPPSGSGMEFPLHLNRNGKCEEKKNRKKNSKPNSKHVMDHPDVYTNNNSVSGGQQRSSYHSVKHHPVKMEPLRVTAAMHRSALAHDPKGNQLAHNNSSNAQKRKNMKKTEKLVPLPMQHQHKENLSIRCEVTKTAPTTSLFSKNLHQSNNGQLLDEARQSAPMLLNPSRVVQTAPLTQTSGSNSNSAYVTRSVNLPPINQKTT